MSAEGRVLTPGRCSNCNQYARDAADQRDRADDLVRQIVALKEHIDIVEHDRKVAQEAWETATGKDWFEAHPW
jgi:hypothetical protein